MSDAYRVATDALIEASKASGGSAYVAGMDDALCSNQAFVVVTALRDAGYLIEGKSDYAILLPGDGANDPALVLHTLEAAQGIVANYQRQNGTGSWQHAEIVKRTVSWRPVEEESNE